MLDVSKDSQIFALFCMIEIQTWLLRYVWAI